MKFSVIFSLLGIKILGFYISIILAFSELENEEDTIYTGILIPSASTAQKRMNNKTFHILKNEKLEVHIDLPLDNYQYSRFDWTGKIVSVKFKGIEVTGQERLDCENNSKFGKGLYNEFGINKPVAYNEGLKGSWFHKIGVGLLKKEDEQYNFFKDYEIKPAEFKVVPEGNKLVIECKSDSTNGYSYILRKEIELQESGFVIKYQLQNTGKKAISTNEYNHNFLAIDKQLIGSQYTLSFPFQIKTGMGEVVNKEGVVEVGDNEITFSGTPGEQFFFSNLSGSESVAAEWELINTKSGIGICETGSFKTSMINLWGWKHVISPELFCDVNVQPGENLEWSRTYTVFER